jgi:hypothetical protein
MKPEYRASPPMTLGNMRGTHQLVVGKIELVQDRVHGR